MGWFDESDDEEEEDSKVRRPALYDPSAVVVVAAAAAAAVPQGAHDKQCEEEDEDDPLDAYMKSIEQHQQQSSSFTTSAAKASSSKQEQQRLDLQNEHDESHYEDDDESQQKAARYPSTNSANEDSQSQQQQQQQQQSQSQKGSSFYKYYALSSWRKDFWTVQQDTAQGRQWRAEHDVACSIDDVDPIYQFHDLIIQDDKKDDEDKKDAFFCFSQDFIDQTLHRQGFQQPTTVQSQTLPVVLSGRDVLVTATTGQGKTLSYAWPLMIHVWHQPPLSVGETGPIGLILVPTRELALQVNTQVKLLFQAAGKVAKRRRSSDHAASKASPPLLTTRAVIGGVGKYILRQEIKRTGGVHVVVATPGRLLDVLSNKKGLSLSRVTLLILDEADKMLQMGFEAQVRQILSSLPTQHQQQSQQPSYPSTQQQQEPSSSRQTLMFSATLGRRVERVAQEWLSTQYVRIAVGQVGACSENVEQHVMVLPNEQAKRAFITSMLPTLQDVGRTLVFCATRQGVQDLANVIRESNNNDNNSSSNSSVVKLEIIHGDLHQSDRVQALRRFTKGQVSVLICTDVAGRGLDIPNVQTVINFDAAKNMDSHVHRIGRAGRLSKQKKDSNNSKAKEHNNNVNDNVNDDNNHDAATQQPQQQPQQARQGTAYTLLTPKNADFAHTLRAALSRQGRPISQELNDLANTTSRRKGSSSSGKNSNHHHCRRGAGSSYNNSYGSRESSASMAMAYYAPPPPSQSKSSESSATTSSTVPPPPKRSRWS